jgi:hypothetical protein
MRKSYGNQGVRHNALMANKRVPVTIQLSPVKDKALIDAIKDIPDGARNGALKEKLAIGFGKSPNESLERELADLRREVEQLRGAINAIPAQLKAMLNNIVVAVPLQVDDTAPETPRISDEEIMKREANLKKREW